MAFRVYEYPRRGNARLFRGLQHHVRDCAIGRRLGTTDPWPVLWQTVCGGLLVAAIFAATS